MKRIYILLIAAYLGISLISCESQDPNATLPYEERIVISGAIDPDSSLRVNISRTLPPLSDDGENDLLYSPLPAVTLSSEGQTWNLTPEDGDLRRYVLKDVYFSAGKTYRLDVKWKNLHAFATTKIPQPVNIIDAVYKRKITNYGGYEGGFIDTTYVYSARFIPVPGAVYRGGAVYNYSGYEGNLQYTYDFSNGKVKDGNGYSKIETYSYWYDELDPKSIDVDFFVEAIDLPYETYYNSQDEGDSPNEVFSSGGVNIKGNIKGDGIGIFVGRNRTFKPAKELIK